MISVHMLILLHNTDRLTLRLWKKGTNFGREGGGRTVTELIALVMSWSKALMAAGMGFF